MSNMLDFLNEMASAETYASGNFFKPGRGVVVVKDVKLFRGTKDPKTFVAEFLVKSSEPTVEGTSPNAPGTSVSYVQKLTKSSFPKVALSNQKKCVLAILGPEAESLPWQKEDGTLKGTLKGEMVELMRVDPATGYTKPGSICEARGVEIAYETIAKDVKGETMHFPEFTHIPFNAETVKANRALLDKVAAEEESAKE
jgi:hypothetical protein